MALSIHNIFFHITPIQILTTMQENSEHTNFTNWKNFPNTGLANCFYGKSDSASQFKRILKLEIPKDDIDKINNAEKTLTKISIYMGLKSPYDMPPVATFSPVFECHFKETEEKLNAEMEPAKMDGSNLPTSIIPTELKDALTKNWKMLENHLIDDVFIAEKPDTETNEPERSRLLKYVMTDDENISAINEISKKEKIIEVHLLLGVDYNKFFLKDQFSFSPILEIRFDKDAIPLDRIGYFHLQGVRFVRYEDYHSMFIEYIRPCPSTC